MCISYGYKSSGELLLSYGFCPPAGANPFDAAHLTFSLDDRDPLLQAKQEALAARDISFTESFGVLIDALPEGLLPYAAFCAVRLPGNAGAKNAASAIGPVDVQELAVQLFDQGELPAVNGVSSELMALEAVVQQCRAALKGYQQSAASDKALAERVAGAGGGYEQRAALVAAIRPRERRILSRTEFVAMQRIKQVKGPRRR